MECCEFVPRAACMGNQPWLILLYTVANVGIAISYLLIGGALWRRRAHLPPIVDRFWVYYAAFILSCGVGHLINVLMVWRPYYWLQGGWDALTALLSVLAATHTVTLAWVVRKGNGCLIGSPS